MFSTSLPDFIPERMETQVERWLEEGKADTDPDRGSRLLTKKIWFASERYGIYGISDYFSALAVCRFRLYDGGRVEVASYLEETGQICCVGKSTFAKHTPADLRTPIQGGSAFESFWTYDTDYYKMPEQLVAIAGFPQTGNYHVDLFKAIVSELIKAGYRH